MLRNMQQASLENVSQGPVLVLRYSVLKKRRQTFCIQHNTVEALGDVCKNSLSYHVLNKSHSYISVCQQDKRKLPPKTKKIMISL